MTAPLRPDDIHRTALLAARDGAQPTLEAALTAHARTGVVICADAATCGETSGQAALLTAIVTAKRAFGAVAVLTASPGILIATGMFKGQTLASVVAGEGARLITVASPGVIGDSWPVVLLGAHTAVPAEVDRIAAGSRPVLRASWSGWAARVSASAAPARDAAGPPCVLAAIAAAALGISEAFGAVRARPGSDAGFRGIMLNLWNPGGGAADSGPALAHAPFAWWLVGLGHLGQAYAWVISWLPYADPSAIEVVLQDTDRTTPANHSTGVLTPEGSDGTLKTRLIADALERASLGTRIIERRLGADLRAAPAECHVALLGVDNLPARRLTSTVRWPFAVDIGLGSGPETCSSLLLRRFPGAQRSDEVTAWAQDTQDPVTIPDSPAFTELMTRHDECGVIQLAGKAVGASFVGTIAACLAVAETTRELHGGTGYDILTLNLTTMNSNAAPAATPANIISAPLCPAAPPSMVSSR